MVYPRISKDIPCISSLMDIHGISKDIPCIYQAYEGGLHIRGIYQAYSRHIPKIGVPDVVCNVQYLNDRRHLPSHACSKLLFYIFLTVIVQDPVIQGHLNNSIPYNGVEKAFYVS